MEQKKLNLLNSVLLPVVCDMVGQPELVKLNTFTIGNKDYCLIGVDAKDYDQLMKNDHLISDLTSLTEHLFTTHHLSNNINIQITSL